ncbi:argininosuccinate lyase [Xylella fastidiosa subsp. sandyi Ann-1]|uniref:Argininosuccinate lyase n=2 Tax=Xylella fastidiosa TaxID=2371 RepID=A0A060H961_XYLFS|nr:argininosuccinate lyase [Xylella fastidiosa subsp. sandyi Ann-1]
MTTPASPMDTTTMPNLLWHKPGVAIDASIQTFLAADDVLLDREFFLYDITASTAHAQALQRIGLLTPDELDNILRELQHLSDEYRNGTFLLDTQYEDGHSAIESRLTERLGDTGRKIHTGRSRNDQILVATRLWLKDRLTQLSTLNRDIAHHALQRAAAEQHLPMPGYTHLQRAVVSSAGMWWAGWAESFIDNALRAADTLALIDCNPLGTAAGYGVNLPLDRPHTTTALGFARLQVNPICAQLSRGKFELAALEALGSATLDLRRIAWDLSLFTTSEFAFITLPPEYSTGSSIMPNKRNPDVIELMRATHASVAAARTEIEQLLSLPSGYHRDLQNSKGAIVRGFNRGLAALELLPALLSRLQWCPDTLRAAIDPGMYATDAAIEAAIAGIPFRDAYQMAAKTADTAAQDRTPETSLTARRSPGAAADLCLETLRARWHTLTQPTSDPDPR